MRWPSRPSSACRRWKRRSAAAGRSRWRPPCGSSRRSASPCARAPAMTPAAAGQRRGRARRPRRLFAPRGHLDRRDLCHAAAVVRRQGRDLRLPHRDRLGRGGLVAAVSRGRAARCGVHPVRRGRGSEPVGLHLSRHQPARPASPDHGVASDHHRRDVRHHHDAAGRARLAADADRGADRLRAGRECCQDRQSAGSRPGMPTTCCIASTCAARPKSRLPVLPG